VAADAGVWRGAALRRVRLRLRGRTTRRAVLRVLRPAAAARGSMSDDATRYPLAWPAAWKRTPIRRDALFSKKVQRTSPGGAPFSSSERLEIADGLARLTGELRRLGATRVVISSNLRVGAGGAPIAKQPKVLADPGVAVYFRLHNAPRVLACDRWRSAADNLAAIAAHIEAIRAQDRYGVGTLDQAFAGYTALPPVGGTHGGDWRAELEVEGFTPPLTLDDVEQQYRRLLKDRHPDRGGSHDAIVRLNRARDAARAYFKDQAH
jgi:hypothetical protein